MKDYLQLSKSTLYDRYPEVFSATKELAEFNFRVESSALNILSFGCSTGEEVKTLHEKYFPTAHITGVDIIPSHIKEARLLISNNKIRFILSDILELEPKKYHVVFCMSVLCRLHHSNHEEKPIAFEVFNKTIEQIFDKIHIGGFLVVYNSNYSILDSCIGDKVVGILHPKVKKSFQEVLMFTNDNGNLKLDNKICIYRKMKN